MIPWLDILTFGGTSLILLALFAALLRRRQMGVPGQAIPALFVGIGLLWSLSHIATVLLPRSFAVAPQIAALLADSGRVLLPLFFGLFVQSLLRQTQGRRRYLSLLVLLTGVWLWLNLTLLNLVPFAGGNLVRLESLPLIRHYLQVIIWAAAAIFVVWQLYMAFKQHYQAQAVNRLQYLALGLGVFALANILFLQPFPLGSLRWFPVLLNLGGIVLVCYLTLAFHPPDLRMLFNRAAATLATASILALPLLGILILGHWLYVGPVGLSQLIGFAAATLALILGLPRLYNWLHFRLQRLFFGRESDPQGLLDTYSREVGGELSIERLCQRAIEFITLEINIDRAALFLDEGDGSGNVSLRFVAGRGMLATGVGHFNADNAWIQHLRQHQTPITQYNLDILPDYQTMPVQARNWLAALEAEVFVPVTLRQQELVGVLALGPKSYHTPYLKTELARLMLVTSQTALDIDKLRMFNQLGQVNQRLEELTTEMTSLDRGKSDFLSIASHELRTPLTQIHGYAAMLVDATETELQSPAYMEHIFNGIARGSNRLKDVVDLIFEVSQCEMGELRLRRRPSLVDELVKQAIETQEKALEQRQLELRLENLTNLPELYVDRTRMVRVLSQLINNAIKYTPDGGHITIQAEVQAVDDGTLQLHLQISDTGIGLAADELARVFDKFYRVGNVNNHSTSNVKFKGAGPGLGLTLTRGVIEAHGGQVWAESAGYDEDTYPGSCFHVTLPLTSQPENPPADTESPSSLSESLNATQPWSSRDQAALRQNLPDVQPSNQFKTDKEG